MSECTIEYVAELLRFGKVEIDLTHEFSLDSTTVRVKVVPRNSVEPYGMLRTLHNKQIETAHFDLIAVVLEELFVRLARQEEQGAPR